MNIWKTGLHIRKTSEEPSLVSPSEPLFSLQIKSTTHPPLSDYYPHPGRAAFTNYDDNKRQE
jgi:hypothetical protein